MWAQETRTHNSFLLKNCSIFYFLFFILLFFSFFNSCENVLIDIIFQSLDSASSLPSIFQIFRLKSWIPVSFSCISIFIRENSHRVLISFFLLLCVCFFFIFKIRASKITFHWIFCCLWIFNNLSLFVSDFLFSIFILFYIICIKNFNACKSLIK